MIKVQESLIHWKWVFSTESISSDSVIETCEMIKIRSDNIILIDKTELYDYYFDWKNSGCAIALWYWSIYNHSYTPNAVYSANYTTDQLIFKALVDIPAWQEIFVNYNWDPSSQAKLWFKV